MGILSAQEMAAVEKERAERKKALKTLTSQPYDPDNKAQKAALKVYMDNFEYSTNVMYVIQAMKQSTYTSIIGWCLSAFLPIPDMVKSLFSTLFYVGLTGVALNNLRVESYSEQVNEMKSLYTWCFHDYSDHLLELPEMQRMINLLAPRCDVQFMKVWPEEKIEEANTGWIHSLASGYASFFGKKPVHSDKVRELKVAVQTQALDVGAIKGFEQAARYFATNTEFRKMLAESARGMLPEVLRNPPNQAELLKQGLELTRR